MAIKYRVVTDADGNQQQIAQVDLEQELNNAGRSQNEGGHTAELSRDGDAMIDIHHKTENDSDRGENRNQELVCPDIVSSGLQYLLQITYSSEVSTCHVGNGVMKVVRKNGCVSFSTVQKVLFWAITLLSLLHCGHLAIVSFWKFYATIGETGIQNFVDFCFWLSTIAVQLCTAYLFVFCHEEIKAMLQNFESYAKEFTSSPSQIKSYIIMALMCFSMFLCCLKAVMIEQNFYNWIGIGIMMDICFNLVFVWLRSLLLVGTRSLQLYIKLMVGHCETQTRTNTYSDFSTESGLYAQYVSLKRADEAFKKVFGGVFKFFISINNIMLLVYCMIYWLEADVTLNNVTFLCFIMFNIVIMGFTCYFGKESKDHHKGILKWLREWGIYSKDKKFKLTALHIENKMKAEPLGLGWDEFLNGWQYVKLVGFGVVFFKNQRADKHAKS